MIDVSLIILNFKSARLVQYSLRSIWRALPKSSLEVIVVDNASGDSLEPIEQALAASPVPAQLILAPRNAGYGAGNNLGMRAARGRYWLIANPDIVFLPDTIDRLVRYLDHHPQAAIAAPALQNPDGTNQPSCFRFHTWRIPLYRRTLLGKARWAQPELRYFAMADMSLTGPTNVDWVMGSCFLVRREAVERVGMFDEQFIMYFEDTDWCRRFHQASWDVQYLPEVRAIHYYRRQSADATGWRVMFSPLARTHIKSAIRYFYKHGINSHSAPTT